VQRILVIDNVELWLSLNRHFAGQGLVRVSEAYSLKTGISLAQVDLPDLVVCSSGDAGPSPAELSRLFEEARLDALPVICVHDRARDETSAVSGNTNFQVCSPDEFLEAVNRVVGIPRQWETSARVDLLAHFQTVSDAPDERRRGFVNLLEIDSHMLLIESGEALQIGDFLDLTFHIPTRRETASSRQRVKVSLRCEIRRCQDENKLLYKARFRKVDRKSEAAFLEFIRAPGAGQEKPA
jgi:hypothetical protein